MVGRQAVVVAVAVVALLVSAATGFSFQDVSDFVFGRGGNAGGVGGVGGDGSSSASALKAQAKALGRLVQRPKASPVHFEGTGVVDLSDPAVPKVRVGARVNDLVNGLHFDSILQDTPDEIRPPSVVVFYDSQDSECAARYVALGWDAAAERRLPARERLFAARYDTYAASRRAWYKFTPEMDLAERFGVTACPQAVYVPQRCNGWTEWCSRGEDPLNPGVELMGCANFTEQCTGFQRWDGKAGGSLAAWAQALIDTDTVPKISEFLRTYKEQGSWIQQREATTTNTMMRNIHLSQAFPAYTPRGFKALAVPPEFQEWLMGFFARHEKDRRTESWSAASTQLSFHEEPTTFLDMDMERQMKEKLANEMIKPIVEEWAGVAPLELTAFYGMREYHEGAWLRNHVDRIDTHVLSVTICVAKHDEEAEAKHPWPLEVVQWSGDHVRYRHPAGTMVLYESSKLPHGRPYHNLGGTHVGAFIHFKPRQMHGADAAKWDEIAKAARGNQAAYTEHASYSARPTEEPERPVFASKSYGEKAKWKHMDEGKGKDSDKAQAEEEAADPQIQATFKNEADRQLDLYWKSARGDLATQGTLGASANMGIGTFEGHTFFFAEHGSKTPLPGATFTIERGRQVYKYDLTRAGAQKAPSKYANLVREKLRSEGEKLAADEA